MTYDLLAITNGGAYNLDFSDERIRNVVYLPQVGEGETVEETITCTLTGTPLEIKAWMVDAEEVLQVAKQQAQDNIGLAITLRVRAQAGDQTWQSRVVDGMVVRLTPKGEVLDDSRLRGTLRLRVDITRQNFWEYVTPVPLLSAQTVYNGCWESAGKTNSLTIAGDSIEGSLPAPLSLELKNTANQDQGDIWVGCDGRFEGGLGNQFEAEDMGYLGAGVSVLSDSACSEGACLAVSGTSGSEQRVGVYTLSAMTLAAAKNRIYRILGMVKDASTDLYGFLKLVYDGVDLATSPTVHLEDGVVDFGVFLLPPWFYDFDSPYDPDSVDLEFFYYQFSGSPSFKLDFLKALPMDGGSAYFENIGIGLAPDKILHVENQHCTTYALSGIGGMFFKTHRLRGTQLKITPGSDARLHFVWERKSGGFDANDTLSVTVTCKPRMRSL